MTDEKPRKLPRQQRSRVLVERILDATARILAGNGYAKLTTNTVATDAGVSIGSLYQYYPNKEALVAAVVERHGQRVYRAIVDAAGLAPQNSLDDAIRRIVEAVVAAHRIDPVLHAVLESEMPKLHAFDGHAATVQAISERLRALPPSAAKKLRVNDIGHAASVVGEMIHALVHSVLIPPATSHMPVADLEQEAVTAVVAYLASDSTRR